MMCEKLRQEFMEAVLSGPETLSTAAQEHLRSCPACAAELASFQGTMSLLDEWQAPEPSPYFNSRLMARVREEASTPAPGWLAWLRRPMVAVTAAVLMASGNFESAAADLQEVTAEMQRLNIILYEAFLNSILAQGLRAAGKLSQARSVIDGAIERSEQTHVRWYLPEQWRLKGEVLLAQDGPEGGHP